MSRRRKICRASITNPCSSASSRPSRTGGHDRTGSKQPVLSAQLRPAPSSLPLVMSTAMIPAPAELVRQTPVVAVQSQAKAHVVAPRDGRCQWRARTHERSDNVRPRLTSSLTQTDR